MANSDDNSKKQLSYLFKYKNELMFVSLAETRERQDRFG